MAEDHVCIQEKELGKILSLLERMVKEFYGNGNEGVSKTIPKMQVQLSQLTEIGAANRVAISALTKAVTEWQAIEGHTEKEQLSNRQKAAVYISAILGSVGIVITIIFKFF